MVFTPFIQYARNNNTKL